MADPLVTPADSNGAGTDHSALIDQARANARARFKDRLENGQQVAGCECESDASGPSKGPSARVAGVRFLDSGQTYFFDPLQLELEIGDWVVVETNRGLEAGRVVISPSQMLQASLSGPLKPIQKVLGETEIERMHELKREAAKAVKTFGVKIREHRLPMKPISAEYNFDGSHLTLNFTAPERVDFRELARDLGGVFCCRVELRQVGPRDEARLLGGVGRCGRTLCCSSWLPVFPEVSMNMAKTQDLPLNPSKVSGVCGRLLCCLSYENDQYRQQKALLPKLGQPVETPAGEGMVVSLQILRELVTVRFPGDTPDQSFSASELGFQSRPDRPKSTEAPSDAQAGDGQRRRRRRGRSRGGSSAETTPQA